MITMYVKEKVLSKERHNACISGNGDYRIKFVLDDEWAGRTVTARFVSRLVCRNVCKDELLDESGECNIPLDILTPGILKVGLFSDEKATTMCDIDVLPSILNVNAKQMGENTETADTIYRQILERLDSIERGQAISITEVNEKPAEAGKLGDIVFLAERTETEPIGWIYAPSGWVSFGKIESTEEIPENALTLADGSTFCTADGAYFLLSE